MDQERALVAPSPIAGPKGVRAPRSVTAKAARQKLAARASRAEPTHIAAAPSAPSPLVVPGAPIPNHDRYDYQSESTFLSVADQPLSTFSIDVDTASYSNLRRFLNDGQLPAPGAVRIEEMLNYFAYHYPQPHDGRPFSVHTELSRCPWAGGHQLLRIGLQGRTISESDRPPANLAFLVDVSGSMNQPDKLPLLKRGLRMMTHRLRDEDRVAIVVYAGSSGVVLPPTSGKLQTKIASAIESLTPGGSTNGASGIDLAYRLVQSHFDAHAINRVILATDGDFNVGPSSDAALVRLIERRRESGIFLTVLGFGRGNLNDSMMEKLADHGNGSYAYLDSASEAKKVLVEQMGGTLLTVAKDVKLQVEMNPRAVAAYRLIGYENRALGTRDFADDRKDAGELGAGQSVTALYEIVPVGANDSAASNVPLKYQTPGKITAAAGRAELATIRLRYKLPSAPNSQLFERAVPASLRPDSPSADQFTAAGIASFGMALRGSPDRQAASYALAANLVRQGLCSDVGGRRAELLALIGRARQLAGPRLIQ